MNYNFFRQIADILPTNLPPDMQHESRQQADELKQEIVQLKLQVATLENALGLVGGRLWVGYYIRVFMHFYV